MKGLMIVSLLLVLLAQAGVSQQYPCSLADSNIADREASRLRTWDALYHSYRRFTPRCDDGSIGEGYSESVARILVDHWDALPRASVLAASDKKFKKFILRHVDATMDFRDLEKIKKNAARNCPTGEADFCQELKRAADGALKELQQ